MFCLPYIFIDIYIVDMQIYIYKDTYMWIYMYCIWTHLCVIFLQRSVDTMGKFVRDVAAW